MNNSTSILVDFLKARLSETEVQAGEVSILTSPLFHMVLRGDAKLPLDRVEDVAEPLGCDKRELFRLAMLQFYTEDAVRLFEKMLTDHVTEAEKMWLHEIRSAAVGEVREPGSVCRRFIRTLSRTQTAP